MKCWKALGLGCVLLLSAQAAQSAHAQTAANINPSVFAEPVSLFPPGATVQASGVETNAAADAQPIALHFGPSWESEGRVSGYYMEAAAPNPDPNGHGSVTAYMVSIFSTLQQAQAAWQNQRQAWALEDAAGGACGPVNYGDAGYNCADSTTTSAGFVSELYFIRGAVLIEIYQYFNIDDFNNCFLTCVMPIAAVVHPLALSLDQIATVAQESQATPTPTAVPSPQPTPTAVPRHITTHKKAHVKSKRIFAIHGSGSHTTKFFRVPRQWALKWSYNCTAFGMKGNFQVDVYGQKGQITRNQGVNQLGKKGRGIEHYHQGGRFYLTLNSECHWTVTVLR